MFEADANSSFFGQILTSFMPQLPLPLAQGDDKVHGTRVLESEFLCSTGSEHLNCRNGVGCSTRVSRITNVVSEGPYQIEPIEPTVSSRNRHQRYPKTLSLDLDVI